MLFLNGLSATRIAKGLNRSQLATLTGLKVDRIRDFETGKDRCEPWLDEARLLSHALCTDGILPLIGAETLDVVEAGPFHPDDVAWMRDGARLPLAYAVRICQHYGLSDPSLLLALPLHRQIWDILERNERGADPGCCAWCLADIHAGQPHVDRCLPNLLFAQRGRAVRVTRHDPKPERRSDTNALGIAYGLKDLRLRAGLTQKQLGELARTNSSYLARIERCVETLTVKKARLIAAALRVDESALFVRPASNPPASAPGFNPTLSPRQRIVAAHGGGSV